MSAALRRRSCFLQMRQLCLLKEGLPMRRVTFSGRFAQMGDDAPERLRDVLAKGIAAVVLDVAIALGVATFSFVVFMNQLVAPYERGFYCAEVGSLSRPYLANTVSTQMLLNVTLITPFVVIFFVESIIFSSASDSNSNRLRKYFSSATCKYLEFLGTYTLSTFAMEAFKCGVARLRPHYLTVCQPDWARINCTDLNNYIENAHCMDTDAHRIRVGRTSFPSGHSAAAVHMLTFFHFYLAGVVGASNSSVLRALRVGILLLTGVWTLFVMVTRVTDYWHYTSDVLAGALLGFICYYVPFGRRSRDSKHFYEYRMLTHNHY